MASQLSRHKVIAPRPAYTKGDFGPESSLTEALQEMFAQTHGRIQVRGRERRATPRVQIELCCEERRGALPYYRTTWDLSTFGCSTKYGQAYPVGTVVPMKLHLPDDLQHPLELKAVVVGTHDETGGMRLTFRNAPRGSLRRIHKYLFARQGAMLAM